MEKIVEIEKLKRLLCKSIERNGICHPKTLKLSQEIDVLIVEYENESFYY